MNSTINNKINIAIDGWSACGKGTLAKGLADKLQYLCIDTGAMYRAFTLAALHQKIQPHDTEALNKLIQSTHIRFKPNTNGVYELFLNDVNVENEIRSKEVNQHVSQFSALSEVRRFLVAQQQEIAKNKGVVMDGRDIGSVVLPDAELKIFMTASPEIRAQRRFNELSPKNPQLTLNEIAENLAHRDHIDSTRSDSPLVQVPDAKVLDNSKLSIAEQLATAIQWTNDVLHTNSNSLHTTP
jgi:CMP/dCMP kinase